MLKTFQGAYGASKTPCEVHAVKTRAGWWYACDGSINVNFTSRDLAEIKGRIWVEVLPDHDFFTASEPVYSPEDIERMLEE